MYTNASLEMRGAVRNRFEYEPVLNLLSSVRCAQLRRNFSRILAFDPFALARNSTRDDAGMESSERNPITNISGPPYSEIIFWTAAP